MARIVSHHAKSGAPAQPRASYSTIGDALRDPASHVFRPGVGYIKLGRLPTLPDHIGPPDACAPPRGTQDRSWHALQPPMGHPSINFRWHEHGRQWFRRDGRSHRLGFTAEYLSRAGWTYLRPVNGPHNV